MTAAVSYPCNLFPPPLHITKTNAKTTMTVAFSVTAMSRSAKSTFTAKVAVDVVAAPPETLLEFSPDSLQYEQGKVGAVPDGGVSQSSVGPMEYLTGILTSKVYDVATESPLQHAAKLSARLGVDVWLKREDAQPNPYH